MIQIILQNGMNYENNPELGRNLSSKEEIQEILDEVGYYELVTKEISWKRLYKRDVKDIIA